MIRIHRARPKGSSIAIHKIVGTVLTLYLPIKRLLIVNILVTDFFKPIAMQPV